MRKICSKLTIEKPEPVSLLLTMNRFYTLFWCFHCKENIEVYQNTCDKKFSQYQKNVKQYLFSKIREEKKGAYLPFSIYGSTIKNKN